MPRVQAEVDEANSGIETTLASVRSKLSKQANIRLELRLLVIDFVELYTKSRKKFCGHDFINSS